MLRKLLLMTILLAAFGFMAVQSPQVAVAQTSWQGQYYNNTFLFDPIVLTRSDGAVAFDWGNGSPAQGVNADGFSVRWTSDPYFQAGTYRFWALADDGLKVTVNFAYTPQINTLDTGNQQGQIVSADVVLSEGVHHVQVDYRENTGNAYAYVTWANLATNPSGPNFPVPNNSYSNINNGQWTAQYYANAALSGSPSLIQSETSPTHGWGGSAPAANLPADNFSARWTSVQNLNAGSYVLSLKADDGVRAFVDGVAVINEWHSASNVTYTYTLNNLAAGQHNFMIEYYEGGGDAFLDYRLTQQGSSVPNPTSVPAQNTGTTAVVNTSRLNVRNAPDTNAPILIKINRNESYPVVGANGDKSWYQINVNGVVGWVFARFVNVSGNPTVPVTNTGGNNLAQPVDTGIDVTALATVNIRSGPSTRQAILGKMAFQSKARIVGRTSNNSWWQVNYGGLVGWVSSTFAQITPGSEIGKIPVTG